MKVHIESLDIYGKDLAVLTFPDEQHAADFLQESFIAKAVRLRDGKQFEISLDYSNWLHAGTVVD